MELANIICAVEDMGKNSVRPSMMAKTMDSIIVIENYFLFEFLEEVESEDS